MVWFLAWILTWSLAGLLPSAAAGVASATPIQIAGLDDISVNAVSAVPEPSTWAMLLLGLAGMAALRFGRPRIGLPMARHIAE
jgi:hypothetical protein